MQSITTTKVVWDRELVIEDSRLTRKVLVSLFTVLFGMFSTFEKCVSEIMSVTHNLNGSRFKDPDEVIEILMVAGHLEENRPRTMGLEKSETTSTADSIKTKIL